MSQFADPTRPIRIGMIGTGFMGQLHSAAYQMFPLIYRTAVPQLELVRIAGRSRIDEAARPLKSRTPCGARVSDVRGRL